ncbi:MAG: hypothetical protein IT210_10610 [Armatimonadetes bacterium]|nr:hypothetical protein [Armatimonadota bacterium]
MHIPAAMNMPAEAASPTRLRRAKPVISVLTILLALAGLTAGGSADVVTLAMEERSPAFLSVPMAAAPVIDGRLDDPAWRSAASFVSLLDQTDPKKSFSYPDNRPFICHDGKNLYIGFETLFPTGAIPVPGQKRGAAEPDVWADDSFELWMDVEGRLYRFAGNAAGGYCESLDSGSEFNGRWTYAARLETRIDNRIHWQGEIRIPFETIGMSDPTGRDLRVNFCRTWRCLDAIGITSLQAATQNYGDRARFATLRLSDRAEGAMFAGSIDPSYGDFRQRVTFHSARGGEFSYTLKALNASGDASVMVAKKITLQPAGRADLPIEIAVRQASAQGLLFEVEGPGGELLARQLVPFRLSEDYLEATPVFGQGRVLLKPRYTMLKGRDPSAAPRVRLLGPEGRVIRQIPVRSDSPQSLPFDRRSPAGNYTADLVSGEGKGVKVHTAKKLRYTGRAAWESLPAPETVPPPFEPLKASRRGQRIEATVWGRRYGFDASLLPASVRTQGRELLAAPARLLIGGAPTAPERLTVGKQSPARLGLSSERETGRYELRQDAWVEYDGVFYNRVRLRAKRDLGVVRLSLPLPAGRVKFLHATASGFGGGGRQNLWLDRDQALPFYPSVWVGDQEGGLAWFTESSSAWRTRDPHPIKILRTGKTTRLEITFADRLSAGSRLDVEFGLLATPARPLPANYPLNLFADNYSVHLNRPAPSHPVTYSGCASWEGAGFFDLPVGEKNPKVWQWLQDHFRHFEKNRAIFTPYTAAMLIPEEYEEAASRIAEWQVAPANHLAYARDDRKFTWYFTCPASDAGKFFAWKFDRLLDKIPLRGIYLDFGPAYRCSNSLHGCHDRHPLLAQRRLYQRLAASFARHGVRDYVIVVHNSECVQWPTFTHVTHFLNGEGLRQMSSTAFHNGKDLQDTYTLLDFASEHSSLPFGITSSIYVPTDPLLPEFGGGAEDQEIYRFRMTRAALAGALVHNTIPSPSRTHYGWYDKIVRIYERFGVSGAEFLPYWRNRAMVRVVNGKGIYVSLFRSRVRPEVLAVVSHISPEHLDQNIEIDIDPAALGVRGWKRAEELLTALDPDYERLYAETNRDRMPIKLGDFGVEEVRLNDSRLTMKLKFHSVALVKLTGYR